VKRSLVVVKTRCWMEMKRMVSTKSEVSEGEMLDVDCGEVQRKCGFM
jgi:hypothetical protein